MSTARDLLWPTDPNILVRFVFLYVGQGSSTIVLVRDNDSYRAILIDTNLDSENGGVNVPELISDLLDGKNLDIFVNTHPHDDHLRGIIELEDKVGIKEIWHSGHKPGKKHDDAYKALEKVIKKVKDMGGNEVKLKGSREEKRIAEAAYYILAPAEYVCDDIEDEDPDTRYRRIHEQCAVLKFGTTDTWGMLPGDADRDAFEKHITEYHKERLASILLAASHHGSRTFFRYDEKDDPYLDALNEIDPSHLIISAPKQSESKWDHPHDDAVKIYKDNIGEKNVHHTGAERHCYIFDIFENGKSSEVEHDNGELAKTYRINGDNGGGDKGMAFTERKEKTFIKGSRYALKI
jgi:competence protein ComEC